MGLVPILHTSIHIQHFLSVTWGIRHLFCDMESGSKNPWRNQNKRVYLRFACGNRGVVCVCTSRKNDSGINHWFCSDLRGTGSLTEEDAGCRSITGAEQLISIYGNATGRRHCRLVN